MEPKAADRLEDNRNPVAATFYGFSVFHCMTQSLARRAGTGTCLGPAATEAGAPRRATRFARLDIKSLTNLFYCAAVILRLLLVWLINTVALIAVAYLMPSISVSSFESRCSRRWSSAWSNAVVRPVLVLLTLPVPSSRSASSSSC